MNLKKKNNLKINFMTKEQYDAMSPEKKNAYGEAIAKQGQAQSAALNNPAFQESIKKQVGASQQVAKVEADKKAALAAAPVGVMAKFKALSTPKKVAIVAIPVVVIGTILFFVLRKKSK